MVAVWLIGGVAMILAGLLAIGFGIPVKEFSFGNTLIFSGTIVACTGIVMIGFWIVIRELRNIAGSSGLGDAGSARAAPLASAGYGGAPGQAAEEVGYRLSRDLRALESKGAEASSGMPPWQDQAAPRERGRANLPPPSDLDEAPPADKPRRNLLFASSSRKERERGPARPSDLSAAESRSTLPPDVSPTAEPGELPRPSFEDAWPKPERSRMPEVPSRRSGRMPSRFPETGGGGGAGYPSAAARSEDRSAAVTVLKSGVVDGMAYSLYSDGSIEAQMPEGMMRFASIDELRAHLDQRG